MTAQGTEIFLELPGSISDRTLHPSKTDDAVEGEFTVVLEERDLPVAEGTELLIYYNRRREFVKQSARIDSVTQSEPDEDGQTVRLATLETVGEPMSAESRQSFRVSTVVSDLMLSFGTRDDCSLVDISPTGFAVVSEEKFDVGSVVKASPRYEDLSCSGLVSVQSVSPRGEAFRYGVHCVEKSMQAAIQQMSMAIQRAQLRRLAGRD